MYSIYVDSIVSGALVKEDLNDQIRIRIEFTKITFDLSSYITQRRQLPLTTPHVQRHSLTALSTSIDNRMTTIKPTWDSKKQFLKVTLKHHS